MFLLYFITGVVATISVEIYLVYYTYYFNILDREELVQKNLQLNVEKSKNVCNDALQVSKKITSSYSQSYTNVWNCILSLKKCDYEQSVTTQGELVKERLDLEKTLDGIEKKLKELKTEDEDI